MRKYILAGLVSAVFAAPVLADSVDVTTTIAASCSISSIASDIDLDSAATTAALNVGCNTTSATVYLGSIEGGLKSQDGNARLIAYTSKLEFTDGGVATHNTAESAGGQTENLSVAVGTGAGELSIDIHEGQTTLAGTYKDTVTVTIQPSV